MSVDVLAIAAHRDDVELTCAGTLLRAADAGHRTGILDLTAGESGPEAAPSYALRSRSARQLFWGSSSGGPPGWRMRTSVTTRPADRPSSSTFAISPLGS